jgi:hypothetical protein
MARSAACGGGKRRAGALLGSARFRIAAAPAVVPIRLRSADRRLARCAGRLRVRAGVAGTRVDFLVLAGAR